MPKNFLTAPVQLSKSPENEFVDPKIVKTRLPTLTKKVDFWFNFCYLSSNIALLGLKKIIRIVPPDM